MSTKTTEQTFPCETWKHSGGRWGGSPCGKPATLVRVTNSRIEYGKVDGEKLYNAICNFHASFEYRKIAYGAKIEAITPEAQAQIEARIAANAKAAEEQRAKKAEERKRLNQLATVRAAEEERAKWIVRREDDERHEFVNGFSAEPVTVKQPRWFIVNEDDPREFDSMEVKVDGHYGQLVIEVRNGSRLTPNAAKALAKAVNEAVKEIAARQP